MPLQATSGAASYDAFGGGVPAVPNYIEEVFSTYLYTGNASTQTITNGIDLATKGGLVWLKKRNNASDHIAADTARGVNQLIQFNTTQASANRPDSVTAFNSNGFSLGTETDTNASVPFVSWTFRKQPKFFDVVTYTGDGTGGSRQVAHNLGSTPGCVLIKRTDASGDWMGFHRNTGATNSAIAELSLNLTTAPVSGAAFSQSLVTSTYFVAGDIQSADGGVSANTNGATYVAYLFAHNAGGFGLTGTDNVISCGSYTGSNTVQTSVDLGYEPQFVLIKNTTTSGNNWSMFDNMRGVATGGVDAQLIPNSTNAELNTTNWLSFTSTGFQLIPLNNGTVNRDANTYIYIAIRRGPMAVPTSGTSVFVPYAYTGNGSASRDYSAIGIPVDMNWTSCRSNNVSVSPLASTRLQGNTTRLQISSTGAEATGTYGLTWNAYQNGVQGNSVFGGGDGWNTNAYTYIGWNFKRAPSFFDEVCYTGTGSARTVSHNLGVAPEMMIAKIRSGADSWIVYHSALGATKYVLLDGSGVAQTDSTMWNNTAPTASVFSLGSSPGTATNLSGSTYVAYLFATATGVSKVGSYTGTGTTQQINCGFTSGARFVLIKRTSTGGGDWYVWDSARGIVSGNDPYLLLNSTAAEVTNTDYVDTYSAGFEISSTAPAAINANGGTFIFLAIA